MPALKQYNNLDFQGTLKVTGLAAASLGSDAITKTVHDSDITSAKARANHTGSQVASTISDFDTQVRISRLDQMAAATASITIVDGTTAAHAATKGQLDTALASLASGQVLKGTVEAYVTTAITLATPGATLDGITAANGEIYFLSAQATASQNGPYVFNGAASAMTRPANWDTSAEAVVGSYWIIKRGTSADAFALMTNDTAITLGTTSITSVVRGLTAGATVHYTTTCPAVSAGATWTITHNLALATGIIQVYRVGSPYDLINVYTTCQPGNVATVQPDIAFTSGEYLVTVLKTS